MSLINSLRGALGKEGSTTTRTRTPKVRKVVFPVAGLGTRFLPVTKCVAKEMLPVVDRPLIQYAVDEACAAGAEELIFVTSRAKRMIEDHFDVAADLEAELQRTGKTDLLRQLRQATPPGVRFGFVRQHSPRGLGHAVLQARHFVGNEPFAVILPDDLIDAPRPALAQMLDQFEVTPASLVAVENVRRDETSRYGIVSVEAGDARVARMSGIVEKPAPKDAPSTLAVVGRYVLTPAIFDCLEAIDPGSGGELQLTDAISLLLQREPVFSFRYSGDRYDCGEKSGYVRATLAYGLRHPEVGPGLRLALRGMNLDSRQPDTSTATAAAGSSRDRHLALVSST